MLWIVQRPKAPDDVVEITLPDGGVVLVEVVEVQAGKARVGYTAPPNVRIRRRGRESLTQEKGTS